MKIVWVGFGRSTVRVTPHDFSFCIPRRELDSIIGLVRRNFTNILCIPVCITSQCTMYHELNIPLGYPFLLSTSFTGNF